MDAPADVVQSVESARPVQHDDAIPKAALTPPTSEDNDPQRAERMSSELSDVDSDDGEDIEPDHYWEGGKIPVFKPVCREAHMQMTLHALHAQRSAHDSMYANVVLCRPWPSSTISNASLRRWTGTE